jgi:hypothetical protein
LTDNRIFPPHSFHPRPPEEGEGLTLLLPSVPSIKFTAPRKKKKRNPNSQTTLEKMLTISGHKRNANQNHTKIPSHPVRIAIIKNTTTNKYW